MPGPQCVKYEVIEHQYEQCQARCVARSTEMVKTLGTIACVCYSLSHKVRITPCTTLR
jgi:hypothetical protein